MTVPLHLYIVGLQQVKVTDKVITYITWLQHSYFVLVVDIICIGHITSYLARNVCHILHSFVLVVDIIFIGNIIHIFVLLVDIICICHIKS